MNGLKAAGFVIGRTNERTLLIASDNHQYSVNEYLKIVDKTLGCVTCSVIETSMYPNVDRNTFPSVEGIAFSLKELNWLNTEMEIHIAKVRVLDDIRMSIFVGSPVEVPDFEEVKTLLMPTGPEEGFTLGVIEGTEDMHSTLAVEHQQIAPLFDSQHGRVMSQKGVPFVFDYKALREYPHIAMIGGSGSGKTFGLRVILEETMTKKIPVLVLDPHFEMDFTNSTPGIPLSFKQDFSRRFETFEVGKDVGIYFPDLDSEELSAIMEHSGNMNEIMINAVKTIHWAKDSETSFRTRLDKLIEAFENMELPPNRQQQLATDVYDLYHRYKSKIAGLPTLKAISWRFKSLVSERIFTHDVSGVEACLLNRKVAVIRGNPYLLNILTGYLVKKLYSKRRAHKDWEQKNENSNSNCIPAKFPPFFVVVDEAHNFAPKTETSVQPSPTKRILRLISQEGRKYGVFLILATQRPSLLDTTISSQLNTKIIFRTGIESDMQMLRTETNLSKTETSRLPELTSGNAYISSATLPRTLSIRFRVTKTVSPHASHPFSELTNYDKDERTKAVLANYLPIDTDSLAMKHAMINDDLPESMSAKSIFDTLEEMVVEHHIDKIVTPMGTQYFPHATPWH